VVGRALTALQQAFRREDTFVVLSRGLMYVGLFFLPMLHLKFHKGLDVSDGIFLIAFILLILARRPPKRAPKTPAWYVGSFLFLLAAVVASSRADIKSASLLVVFNAIFVFFILQYLLRQQLDTTKRLQNAMIAYIAGSSISAFVAILQADFHVLTFTADSGSIGSGRAIGLSTQPNLAGVTFALAITFGVGLLLERGLRHNKWLGAFVAVNVAALLLAASVSGMASTLVGLFVLFLARGVSWKKVLAIALSLLAVYMLVFGVIDRGSHLDPITRIEKTTNQNSGSGTLQLRIDTITESWAGIITSPIIGHGLDQQTLAVFYDNQLFIYYPAHNLVILVWYGGGIFMLVAFCIMMGSAIMRTLHGRRRLGKNRDPMKDIILAGCIVTLFFSMQSPELVDRWLWLPFLLAFCVRDPAPAASADATLLEQPALAPAGANGTNGRGNGRVPRRVRGSVERGRHVATEVTAAEPSSGPGRHAADSVDSVEAADTVDSHSR
jgi:hypothetical protein